MLSNCHNRRPLTRKNYFRARRQRGRRQTDRGIEIWEKYLLKKEIREHETEATLPYDVNPIILRAAQSNIVAIFNRGLETGTANGADSVPCKNKYRASDKYARTCMSLEIASQRVAASVCCDDCCNFSRTIR